MTYQETIAKNAADIARIRAAGEEYERARDAFWADEPVYNPDINRSSIAPYPPIAADIAKGDK